MNREKLIADITFDLPALGDGHLLAVKEYVGRLPKRPLTEEALRQAQFERDQVAERANNFRDLVGVSDGS